ncbi:SufE family protein [Shewanella dokdonensis]|uniref:SufE family protein n=1 Tax=Shewanella dokdonensis TaxID=712036 RepID=A0ABX8DH00_9GAMM|nr:SufE family protein [Shewanella dokdonensis]MCL1074326.1 SufE family protein [Shewanella dokdonensis]QVK24017.1 SufE family protein [Shewanella dokdonensis]
MPQPDVQLFDNCQQQQPLLQQAAEAITAATNWQDKYRLLMQAGKLLPQLPPQWQQQTARVSGCESAVWLYHLQQQQRHLYLADSDARIVRGLIALLLAAVNNATSAELAAFSAEAYFARLGLAGQLSPSRSNGLYAIANTMKNLSK